MNQALEGEGRIFQTNGHSVSQDLLPDTKLRKPLTFEQFSPFISLDVLDTPTATLFPKLIIVYGFPNHVVEQLR